MSSILQFITQTIVQMGYFGIFLLSFMGSALLPPLPSEIIFPFSGFLVFKGHFNFWLVCLTAVLGESLGATFLYFLGKKGIYPVLLKYGKYICINEKKLDIASNWFSRYGTPSIFFCRMLPVLRAFIPIPAGISSVSYLKFFTLNFFGSLLWIMLLVHLGVVMGNNWQMVKSKLSEFDWLILLFFAVCLIIIIFKICINKHKKAVTPS